MVYDTKHYDDDGYLTVKRGYFLCDVSKNMTLGNFIRIQKIKYFKESLETISITRPTISISTCYYNTTSTIPVVTKMEVINNRRYSTPGSKSTVEMNINKPLSLFQTDLRKETLSKIQSYILEDLCLYTDKLEDLDIIFETVFEI